MYFTSWDANVFLCLLSVFPEEVVRGMIKMVKEVHEDYVKEESLEYWLGLPESNWIRGFSNRHRILQEFTELWKWRSPESRRVNIIQWSRYIHSHVWSQEPHTNRGEGTSRGGYWNSGEAWWYSIKDRNLDISEWSEYEEDEYFDMKERERREYVSDWYGNIHEGRYFLFFKENDIISSDYIDTVRNNQNRHIKSISDIGDRWQIAQDLLTIDGGGIGHKPGNHIEHIDDLF